MIGQSSHAEKHAFQMGINNRVLERLAFPSPVSRKAGSFKAAQRPFI